MSANSHLIEAPQKVMRRPRLRPAGISPARERRHAYQRNFRMWKQLRPPPFISHGAVLKFVELVPRKDVGVVHAQNNACSNLSRLKAGLELPSNEVLRVR